VPLQRQPSTAVLQVALRRDFALSETYGLACCGVRVVLRCDKTRAARLHSAFPKPPTGELWVHEVKHDGYRLQVNVRAGRVRA
jgi:hypothetical protein